MAEDLSVLSRAAAPPDHMLRYAAHSDQVIDVWYGDRRAADRPVAVLLHGGFWRPEYDRVHVRPMAHALSAVGWSVASVEYRREPGRPDSTVGDVRTALERLPRLLAESGRLEPSGQGMVLIGHSAGGHLALWAATAVRPAALRGTLALAPVADLALADRLQLDEGAVAAFLGSAGSTRPDLDPVVLAGPPTPVTIIHGTADTVVPITLAESYVAAHRATRHLPVSGVGHYEVIDPLSLVWPLVTTELSRCGR